MSLDLLLTDSWICDRSAEILRILRMSVGHICSTSQNWSSNIKHHIRQGTPCGRVGSSSSRIVQRKYPLPPGLQRELLAFLARPLRLACQNDIESIRRIALLGDQGSCWDAARLLYRQYTEAEPLQGGRVEICLKSSLMSVMRHLPKNLSKLTFNDIAIAFSFPAGALLISLLSVYWTSPRLEWGSDSVSRVRLPSPDPTPYSLLPGFSQAHKKWGLKLSKCR